MDAQKVDMFLMSNNKYFESFQLASVKSQLLELDESKWINVVSLQLKDPTTALIISLLGGALGIDRFFIGDVGLGIGKLLTCGGFSIWAIVDWFLIQAATKEKNFENLQKALLF
ncbi:MAG: TM2 domain-containing protein [Tannerellaceae bacterium]|jgi:TM2 domain-containing membrane protein YozV|nr:TM2 domain-containing protein [Tannerellaceae bacterium]